MNPLGALAALGAAGIGWMMTKKSKPTVQTLKTTSPEGVPVKVVVPVPANVTQAQAAAQPTTEPVPSVTNASHPVQPVQIPNQGTVYAPAKSIQVAAGVPQPPPIVVTPSGASSTGISTLKDVQRALNTLGYQPPLTEDGILGPKTIANVKAFQGASGLVVDGNAGPATKTALAAALAKMAGGASVVGHAVQSAPSMSSVVHPSPTAVGPVNPAPAMSMSAKDIQGNLNLLGANPPLTVDGQLGPKSIAAIKAFQTAHGLVADGIVGPKTKMAIYLALHPTAGMDIQRNPAGDIGPGDPGPAVSGC